MEEKATVVFNISGGNNQIAPNATVQKQVFIGDQFAEDALAGNLAEEKAAPQLSDAEKALSVYINNVELLRQYVARLEQCASAADMAKVAVDMRKDPDVRADKLEIVKRRFIEVLLALAPNVENGRGVNNVRRCINDAWGNRNR